MILLVNGPNLNLLGEREPDVYGHETLADVERMVSETCAAYGIEVKALQSNWEGALLDFLQEHRHEAQGVILNPGAFTHTSRALPDCLRAMRCPIVEVHVSNVHAREAWRRESFVSPVAQGQVVGLGIAGYYYAALHLCSQIVAQAGAAAEGAAASPEPGAAMAPQATRGVERPAELASLWTTPPASAAEPAPEPPEEPSVDRMARGEYEPL